MDENERLDPMDYDSLQEQRTDELTALLDNRNMRTLKQRMEEMNEFYVAEFLSGIQDNRMPMVFRLLSKETAADVFANFEAPYSDGDFNFTFKFAATGAVTVKCVYAETNGSASGTATLIPSCDPDKETGAFEGFVHVGLQAKAKKFPGYFDRFFVHWDGEAFTVTGVGD